MFQITERKRNKRPQVFHCYKKHVGIILSYSNENLLLENESMEEDIKCSSSLEMLSAEGCKSDIWLIEKIS